MSSRSSLAPVLFLFFSLGCHIALASLWEAGKWFELRDTGEVPASLTVTLVSQPDSVKVAGVARKNNSSVQKTDLNNLSGKQVNKPGSETTESARDELALEKPALRPVEKVAVARKKEAVARKKEVVIRPKTIKKPLPVTRKNPKAADKLASAWQQIKLESQPLPLETNPSPEPVFRAGEEVLKPSDQSKSAPLRDQLVETEAKRFRFTDSMTPAPGYPAFAKRRGWQGEVLIELLVAADGSLVQAEIKRSSGHKILDKAALRALSGWQLRPSSKVLETLYIPVRFELK